MSNPCGDDRTEESLCCYRGLLRGSSVLFIIDEYIRWVFYRSAHDFELFYRENLWLYPLGVVNGRYTIIRPSPTMSLLVALILLFFSRLFSFLPCFAIFASVDDDSMDAVASLPGLTTLTLRGTKVTGAGIARLSSLGKLRSLNLAGTFAAREGEGGSRGSAIEALMRGTLNIRL